MSEQTIRIKFGKHHLKLTQAEREIHNTFLMAHMYIFKEYYVNGPVPMLYLLTRNFLQETNIRDLVHVSWLAKSLDL